MRAWQDGRHIDPQDAHVTILDRGLLLGDGVFETMAIAGGRALDLDAHLARLSSGLALLGFAQAVDLVKLGRDIAAYAATEGKESAVLRVTVTRGSGPRGLAPPQTPNPSIFMTLAPMPRSRTTPLSLHIAAGTRRNEFSPLSRIKALPYLDNLLALSEARAAGADEALLLNTHGTLACASVANLFRIKDGRLETPPLGDGALPGTMRALVLSCAEAAGLVPRETSMTARDLHEADHVFLTNSVSRLTEAGQCDGKPLRRQSAAALERLRACVAAALAAPAP